MRHFVCLLIPTSPGPIFQLCFLSFSARIQQKWPVMGDSDDDQTRKPAIPTWQQAPPTAEKDKPAAASGLDAPEQNTLEQARKFLEDEEVRRSPPERKAEFLRSKGFEQRDIDQLLSEEDQRHDVSPVPATVNDLPPSYYVLPSHRANKDTRTPKRLRRTLSPRHRPRHLQHLPHLQPPGRPKIEYPSSHTPSSSSSRNARLRWSP